MGADKPGTSCNDRFQTPPPFCAFTFKILSSLLLKLWFQDSMLKRAACLVPAGVVGWILPDQDLRSGKRSPVGRSVIQRDASGHLFPALDAAQGKGREENPGEYPHDPGGKCSSRSQ